MDKPILFSGEMVCAILDGKKTQTRRVVKLRGASNDVSHWLHYMAQGVDMPCPYGQAGDRLYVRETWKCEELASGLDGVRFRADNKFQPIENTPEASDAWCDANRENGNWRPSIFMPRWASRITLEVVSVRVERVQDISDADAKAEGMTLDDSGRREGAGSFEDGFAIVWDRINSKRGLGWDVNPWVWVVEFKVVTK